MKVLAQSQPPAKLSYIHLAYISAGLGNKISKGELLSVQAIVGVAIACAIVCATIGAKLARGGRCGQAAKIGGFLGFFATLGVLWLVQATWSETRSDEAAVQHIIQTRQYWALREAPIAAGVEAAALTNGTAASLAATYYGLKGSSGEMAPELKVKGYRYCELAAAQGQVSHWVRPSDLTNTAYAGHLAQIFEAALEQGKLTEPEQTWTRQQLARLEAQTGPKDSDKTRN